MTGTPSPEEFWDERYRSRPALWSGDANPLLVEVAASLEPGRALDAGAGEGGDAIHLARLGWEVTAIDVSSVALGRAADHAAEAGTDVAGRIRFERADLSTDPLPPGPYDLVSVQYLHLPPEARLPALEHLRDVVAPGGRLLVVGHDVSDLSTGVQRPQRPEVYFSLEEVGALLPEAGWVLERSEAVPRQVSGPDGRPVTVHDAVVLARRR